MSPSWLSIRSWTDAIGILASALPHIVRSLEARELFHRMRKFVKDLPQRLSAPLPESISNLLAGSQPSLPAEYSEETIRQLADLAVLLDRGSTLGLCLRRSLTRFTFLRQSGLPVVLHFGVSFAGEEGDRQLTGHAWLTLDGRPYYEDCGCQDDFTVMLTFPDEDGSASGQEVQ